jgi:hypothetical protein
MRKQRLVVSGIALGYIRDLHKDEENYYAPESLNALVQGV